MLKFRDASITGKLTWMNMVVSAVALLLACGAFITYETVLYRQTMVNSLSVQAQIIGDNSVSAVLFNDAQSAETTLAALRAAPHVTSAWIFTPEGKPFAGYGRDGTAAAPNVAPMAAGKTEEYSFKNGQLALMRAVTFHDKLTALVYIQSDLTGLYERLERFVEIGCVVLLASLLAALLVSWASGRVVARPIQELSQTARVVSRDNNYEIRATPSKARDEIADLIDTFNTMLAQIQERDDALQKALDNLNTAMDSLREINRQVRESVEILAGSASEILATTAQVASGAAQTAAAVSETTAVVEQAKNTAQLSTQKAKYVSDSAQKSAEVSQAGQRAVNETIDGMNRIGSQMQSIAHSIMRLSEQGLAIGEIIATVNDLADRTNILAVNAAIEAAKAGEHGRGFAVVAQEVKSLAEQSKKATAQIRSILGEIHNSTRAVVNAAEQGSKTVEAGVEQSAQTGAAVKKLTDSITDSALAAIQIAASTREQLVGMDQVVLAMDNIKQASLQNVAATRQTELAARNMHELGQKLRQLVEQYKA